MKTWDAIAATTPVSEFPFTGQQAALAAEYGATRAWRHRYTQGVRYLPQYIIDGAAHAGYAIVYLGGTTYRYSVFGLRSLDQGEGHATINGVLA